MKIVCDGSRRPVHAKRHQLERMATKHQQATCPVCKQRIRVFEILGVLEFPRHEPDSQ